MNEPPRIADQDARDVIAQDIQSSMIVSAGAGTGKTTALVGRLLTLVTHPDAEQRVPLRNVAAITFTEAAAAELKDRLRRRLRRATIEDPSLSDVLAELDSAAIQTIHGFARRILNLDPLAAGLPPGFQVLDGVQASLRMNIWWDATLERLLADPKLVDAWDAALEYEIPLPRFRKVAERMMENPERSEDSWIPDSATFAPVEAVIADLEGQLSGLDPADKYVVQVAELLSQLQRIDRTAPEREWVRSITQLPRPEKRSGARKAESGVPALKAQTDGAISELVRFASEVRLTVVAPIIQALRGAISETAQDRRREGMLQFSDLLVLARDVLRNPKYRVLARRQFTRILVDEFQDTDPLQLEIIRQLADDAPVRFADGLPETFPNRGELFLVGDVQQSIYRFRRADVRLFSGAVQIMPNLARLAVNFRSTAPVLDWINQVYGSLGMEYQPLKAPPSTQPVPPSRIVAIAREPVGKDGKAGEMADAAAAIARILTEQWPVRDGDRWRPVKADDIAVLYPTRTHLGDLEHELTVRGIAYRVESQTKLFELEDVREFLNVLRAISNSEDEVSLVGALKSPAFGLDDADLEAHASAEGRWFAPEPQGDPASAVSQACAVVAGWQRDVGNCTVTEWMGRLIEGRSWWASALGERRPQDRWQRLRRLTDHARRFEMVGRGTLGGFLDYCADQAEQDAAEVERVAPESDDVAVRLMTVHAAKGLEFPVVVVVGLGGDSRPMSTPIVGFDHRGISHLALSSVIAAGESEKVKLDLTKAYVATARSGAFVTNERGQDREERRRLAYVAITRACDHLVVNLHHLGRGETSASPPSVAQQIANVLPESTEIWERPGLEPLMVIRPTEAPDATAAPVARWTRRAAYVEWRTQVLKAAPQVRAIAATTLSAMAEAQQWAESRSVNELIPSEEEGDDLKFVESTSGAGDDDALVQRRGRKGAHLGRAIHTALQTLDPRRPMAWGAVVEAQCAAEGVPELAEEALRLIQRAAASPSVVRAWSQPSWREAYLARNFSGTIVEGYLDLLTRLPDGRYAVVDYKTDADVSPGGIAGAMERYRVQGGAYAELVESTLGAVVASVTFVFVNAEPAIEVEVDNLPYWQEYVRRQVTILGTITER